MEQPRATSPQLTSCCSVTSPLRRQPHRRALPLHSVQIYTTLGASTVLILLCCGSVKKTKKSTSKSTVHVRDFHREVVSVKQPHSGLRHSPAAAQQPWSHHVPTVRSCCEERGTHITSLTSPHAARMPPELTAQQQLSCSAPVDWFSLHVHSKGWVGCSNLNSLRFSDLFQLSPFPKSIRL